MSNEEIIDKFNVLIEGMKKTDKNNKLIKKIEESKKEIVKEIKKEEKNKNKKQRKRIVQMENY